MRLLRSVARSTLAAVALTAVTAASAVAAGSISGTITNQNGAPIKWASVRIVGDAHRVTMLTGEFPDGTFKDPDVPPGTYTIEFSAQASDHLVRQFYPAVPTLAAAQVITVADAPVTGINARLAPAASIAGTIRDSSGAPVRGTAVWATYNGVHVGQEAARTDANGAYSIGSLPAGTYGLSVEPIGTSYVAATRPDPITLVAGQAAAGVDQTLALVTAPSTPPAPQPASTSTPLPQLPASVGDLSPSLAPTFDPPAKKITVAADGTFTLSAHCATGRHCFAPLRVVAGKYVAPKTAAKGTKAKKVKAQPSIATGTVDTKVVDSTATVRLNAAGKKLLRAAKHGLKVTFLAQPGWSDTPTTKYALTLFAAPKKK